MVFSLIEYRCLQSKEQASLNSGFSIDAFHVRSVMGQIDVHSWTSPGSCVSQQNTKQWFSSKGDLSLRGHSTKSGDIFHFHN